MAPHGYNTTTKLRQSARVKCSRGLQIIEQVEKITKLLIFGLRTFLWHASAKFVPATTQHR